MHTASNTAELAEDRCHKGIEWYCSNAKLHRHLYYGLQSFVIVVGAASSLLVATNTVGLLPAIIPAFGTIAAGLLASFGVHERWVHSAATAELLKSELWLFQLRVPQIYAKDAPPDDHVATFALRVNAITLAETEAWKLVALRLAKEQKEDMKHVRGANAPIGGTDE